MSQFDAATLWAKIKSESIAKLEFNLVLADALNAVVPITVDGEILVLGYAEGALHHTRILGVPDKVNLINNTVKAETGGAVTTHTFVEGTAVKDWEYVKERKVRAAAHTDDAIAAKKVQSGSVSTIDDLIQELHRRYGQLEGRGFPQVKAKWLMEILPSLVQVEEQLRTRDDQYFRNFARVIDKVAALTEIPAVTIGLEIERLKRARPTD